MFPQMRTLLPLENYFHEKNNYLRENKYFSS